MRLRSFLILYFLIFFITCYRNNLNAVEVRLKDIMNFEGVRDNILVGYGLVVGLNGTGDNLRNSIFTEKGLIDFLERLGVNSKGGSINTKNVAAVMVTSTISAFSRTGGRIPVTISTIGDAKSLKGGTLVATPLLGADGEVYAVAQGTVSIGTITDPDPAKARPTPTSGYISGGGIVEKEIEFSLRSVSSVKLALKNPDITTARAITTAINNMLHDNSIASTEDPGTIHVQIPKEYISNAVDFLAEIEGITIQPDHTAKIVIDEATGTVAISENVKISPIAVSQGDLRVKISDQDGFIQSLLNVGKNKNNLNEEKSEPGTNLAIIENNSNLDDLVNGLNALAVKTPNLIAILKTIQQAGALQAEIIVR